MGKSDGDIEAASTTCQACGLDKLCLVAYNEGGYSSTAVCFDCIDAVRPGPTFLGVDFGNGSDEAVATLLRVGGPMRLCPFQQPRPPTVMRENTTGAVRPYLNEVTVQLSADDLAELMGSGS